MFDKFQSRLNLKGKVETQTAIRVGAGRSTAVVGSDLPVVRDAEGAPYIPGSSFKGVLRSYVESILRSFAEDKKVVCKKVVCNPTKNDEQCIPREEKMEDDQLILDNTCWVCQLFGSLWYASKLQIRDLYIKEDQWFGQYQHRDGVAIDRDTETAVTGHLYDFEVVPAGTQFNFKAIVDNATDWQLGMLYIGLTAFRKGEITISGGSSRGLGAIKLELDTEKYIDSTKLLDYLTKDYKGENAKWDGWVQTFKDKVKNQLEGTDAQTDG